MQLRTAIRAALAHHCELFREARKPSDAGRVAAALAQGEFAAGRRSDINLWSDVVLAVLLARRSDAATECFQRLYAARVAAWETRFSRGKTYGWAEFVADLLLPRKHSGPRIESYTARGPFDGWLKQVYQSLCRKRDVPRPDSAPGGTGDESDDEGANLASSDESPAQRFARLDCAERLTPLLTESMQVLQPDDRTLVQMIVLDGAVQKKVAALYGLREYEVTRRKQKALERIAETFFALAAQFARMGAASVRECVQLLLERFPKP